MYRPQFVVRILAVLILARCFTGIAFGQQQPGANVNENLETAQVWVDAVNGSDTNPGTQALPLQTIGASITMAIQNNQNDIGTTVLVNPGTYREVLTMLSFPNQTNMPITIEAVTPSTVLIDGADLWTGWQPTGSNPSIYSMPWPYQWGFCQNTLGGPIPNPIMLRQEQIFVNGQALTQVLSQNQMYYPGTFMVDETNGVVYIWPPNGTDMGSASIEVSTRPQLLLVQGIQNLVFRGLTFENTNSCWGTTATQVVGPSSNILFDTDSFLWNNALGFHVNIPATNITVQNSTANHNGEAGVWDYQVYSILYQNDNLNFNGWRGALGTEYSANTGGAYPFFEHFGQWTNVTAAYNYSHGIHWDTNGVNINVSNFVGMNNYDSGIFLEKNNGPITVSNSSFCNNVVGGSTGTTSTATGLLLRMSEQITLNNNMFYNNQNSSLGVVGIPGGIQITDWQTNQNYQVVTENTTLTNNVFEGSSQSQGSFMDGILGGADWTSFQSTLYSDNNTWWNPVNSMSYILPVPVPVSLTNFPGWQAATGQDPDSTFSAPTVNAAAACTAQPDYPDFWLTIDNGTLNMAADGTAVFNPSITPLGFSGQVDMTLDGISEVPGLNGGLASNTINTSGTTQVNLQASPITPPGTYPITIVANSGNITHAETFNFVIPLTSVFIVPATLNFPNTQVNIPSAPLTAVMTNYGTSPLVIHSILPSMSQFAESDDCNGSLAPDSSCTISVVFTPNNTDVFQGTLAIVDTDPNSPQTVSLYGLGIPAPQVQYSPASVVFGNVEVNSGSAPQTVTLSNVGQTNLIIQNVAITGTNASEFQQTNNCPGTLTSGNSCTFNVIFWPSVTGNANATLVITDNTYVGGQTIPLSGYGSQSQAQLSSNSISFPSTNIGSHNSSFVTLSNSGNSVLQISNIGISGTNTQDFSETTTCGANLYPNNSCKITVTFAPVETGNLTAVVNISDNAPNSPQTISLSGTGTQPVTTFSPNSLTFGTQLINTTTTLPLQLTNSGTGPITFTSVTITGAGQGWFTQTNNCGASLNAGASCTINVSFTPTGLGTVSPTLNFTDNAPGSPQSIPLNGTGGQPAVTLSPTNLNFGTQNVGQPSAAQTITLTNSGTYSLSVSSISLGGQDPGDFSESDNCVGSVAVSATCTISIIFDPTTTGSRSAALGIYDNAPASPQTVSLSGTGITTGLSISPASLTFGNQNVNTISAPQTATLTNTGSVTITFTQAPAVTGQNPADFPMSTNCGASLAAGKSCIVTVKFQPTASGLRSASVSISDNLPGSPQSIPLSGTGVQPTATLTSNSVNFGNQLINTPSQTQIVTLTNNGNGTLDISNMVLGGANKGWFSYTTTCGTTVPPGSSCQFNFTFTPPVLGNGSASLTLTDDAPDSPQVISLSGTGVAPAVTLSPTSLAFGQVVVNVPSAPQTVTLTNSGTYALMINSIVIAGTDPQDYSQSNNCGSSLQVSASCTITVIFTPTATGSRPANITISDNAGNNPQTVGLSGSGITEGLTISPSSVSFGNELLNLKSGTQVITLTNNGSSKIQFPIGPAISGDILEFFILRSSCGLNLQPGGSCTVTLYFLPLNLGLRQAQLVITDNLPNSPQQIPLSGTGVQSGVTLNPASLNFGTVPQNQKSAAQTVTLTNSGQGNLTLSSGSMGGADPSWFSLTHNCPGTLAPGASCTLTFTATPKQRTTGTATLTIKDNAPDSPQAVNLSVTGS